MGKFDAFLKSIKNEVIEHSPEILTGFGITSMLSAIIFSIKATPNAKKAIDDKKKELEKEKLTVLETVSACWKHYIPTTLSFAAGVACIIGGNSIVKKRAAAIAAAYSITETALTEYKSKAAEVLGEAKEQSVREKITDDKIKENPPKSNEVIITNKGDTLFYETISGRYFKSDIEKVRRAENELNRTMRDDIRVSLNDVFMMLGLPMTSRVNDDIGWDIDHGYIEFTFTAHITEDSQPCIALDYRTLPKSFPKFA